MSKKRKYQDWVLKKPYSYKNFAAIFAILIVLTISSRDVQIPKMVSDIAEYCGEVVGINEDSQIGDGLSSLTSKLFPIVIEERSSIDRIENFDRDNLPLFSSLEVEKKVVEEFSSETFQLEVTLEENEVLVKPVGYLVHVLKKMYQSLEIALWGTIISILISIPLAYCSAANYTPHRGLYHLARLIVSFLRAIPELVSALFLVLAFGFGPVAGILALSLHCAGFLGKFYAEDIENAEKAPQDVLLSVNAGKLKTLVFAVLPQVFPQYVAYMLYILDRNVRMSIVVGIVGAGGIGMELKGRFDMFDYGHVATILLVLFVTVFLLDQISAKIRTSLIQESDS